MRERLGRYGRKERIGVFVTIQGSLRSYYRATMRTRSKLSTDGEAGEAVDAAIARRIGHSEEFEFGPLDVRLFWWQIKANERQG